MKAICKLTALTLGAAAIANGQGRPLDWPFFGGDAQRSGWEKSDLRITKENVKDFQLILKRKLEPKGGPLSLTPPVVLGNLISYKGFKELGFLTGSSGEIWSLDLDIDRIFWHKQLPSTSKGCAGGAMAIPTLTPPPDFTARPRPTPAAASASPGIPPSPAGAPSTAPHPSILGSTAFGAPRPAFALSKDGKLHVLNTSTGDDLTEPFPFVPANSRASSLAIADGTLYTTTVDCAGKSGAVWALDLDGDDRKITSYELKDRVPGLASLSVGKSHTVYVAGSDGSLTALASKTLKPTTAWEMGAVAAPLVFTAEDRDRLIVPSSDGRLVLVDSKPSPSLQIYATPPIGKLWGGISSWTDADETRYIAVPVWGPMTGQVTFPVSNGAAPDGSIAVFKVEDTKLTPVWSSHNLQSPETPVITSGVVFTVAAGGPHATFYAFDGATGKEMYSSKDQVTAPGNLNGLSIANGRVFFTTTDGTLYGFGIFLDVLGR